MAYCMLQISKCQQHDMYITKGKHDSKSKKTTSLFDGQFN